MGSASQNHEDHRRLAAALHSAEGPPGLGLLGTHLSHLLHGSVISVQHARLDEPLTKVKHLQDKSIMCTATSSNAGPVPSAGVKNPNINQLILDPEVNVDRLLGFDALSAIT